MTPEIPLSDAWDRCCIDAEVLFHSAELRRKAKKLPPMAADVKAMALAYDLEAMLSEHAVWTWIGHSEDRPRPVLGKSHDVGDLPGEGNIKSAPDYRDKFRKHQLWTIADRTINRSQWVVFVTIERGRILGPVYERQRRMAEKCLVTRRWIEGGRWLEPVAVIRGWLPMAEVEKLPPQLNEKDGQYRMNDGYRKVPIEMLRPWPEHPRPISAWKLRDLLDIEPGEEERQGFLKGMKQSISPLPD